MTDDRCGRPTVADRPCRQFRACFPVSDLRFWLGLPAPEVDLPPSCWRHMTKPEREYMWTLEVTERAEVRQLWVSRISPPACWSWPMGAREWATAEAIRRIDDVEAVHDLSVALLNRWQNGRCAVCGGVRWDVIDHDHGTGLIRGLLCTSCNLTEPHWEPDHPHAGYRERNPATIIGIRAVYYHPIFGWARPQEDPTPVDRAPGWALAAYLSAQ